METEPILPSFQHLEQHNTFVGQFNLTSNHNQMDAEMEVEEMQQDTAREFPLQVFTNNANNGNFLPNVNQQQFLIHNSNPNHHHHQQQSVASSSSTLTNVPNSFSNSTLNYSTNQQSMQSLQQNDFQTKSKAIIATHQHVLSSQSVSLKAQVPGSEENDDELYEDDGDEEEDDDEDDFDILDDIDEQMVQQMLLSTTPENQQAIRLLLSGYSACASETIRYLVEEEQMSPSSPMLLALVQHLKMQETMLIVSCLRTQHMLAQQQQQAATALLAEQTSSHPAATIAGTDLNNCKKEASKTSVTQPANNISISATTAFVFNPINRHQFQNADFNDSGFVEQ